MRRLRDAGALPLDGRTIVTEAKDLIYYTRRESRAREEAYATTDISARIAHLAAADGYAAEIVVLKAKVAAGA